MIQREKKKFKNVLVWFSLFVFSLSFSKCAAVPAVLTGVRERGEEGGEGVLLLCYTCTNTKKKSVLQGNDYGDTHIIKRTQVIKETCPLSRGETLYNFPNSSQLHEVGSRTVKSTHTHTYNNAEPFFFSFFRLFFITFYHLSSKFFFLKDKRKGKSNLLFILYF